MPKINPSIFHVYDIRGKTDEDINRETAYLISRAICLYLKKYQKKPFFKKPRVLVARDVRESSLSLAEAVIEGINDSGFDVVDTGVSTTPLFSFAVKELGVFGGIMVTASHNPSDNNGFKMMKKGGEWIGDAEIREIADIAVKEVSTDKITGKKGGVFRANLEEKYIGFLTRGFSVKRKMKIVVDAGGGAVSVLAKKYMDALGIVYEPMFFDADGSFSSHPTNPRLPDASEKIIKKIKETNADFGVAFDADGDRMAVTGPNGEIFNGDIIGGVLASGCLKEGSLVVVDSISTRALELVLAGKKINVLRCKVGHLFLRREMEKHKADFGIEFTGHYYFKNFNYSDSALYAMRFLLEVFDRAGDCSISDLARPFSKFFNSGSLAFPLTSADKWPGILESVKKEYSSGKQSFEDGITVDFGNWWFNLRPANTEPVMRLVVEAESEILLEEKKKEITGFLSR